MYKNIITYLYLCTVMYTCMYVHVPNLCTCTCMYVHVPNLCTCMYVHVHVPMYITLGTCTHKCMYVLLCNSLYVNVSMYMYMYVCICAYVYTLGTCTHKCMFVLLCMLMYLCTYTQIYVYARHKYMHIITYDSGAASSFAFSTSIGPNSSLHFSTAFSLAKHSAIIGPLDM